MSPVQEKQQSQVGTGAANYKVMSPGPRVGAKSFLCFTLLLYLVRVIRASCDTHNKLVGSRGECGRRGLDMKRSLGRPCLAV